MNTDNYTIEKVQNKAQYEGLRTLWCEVFGDEPFYVDNMYRAFGEDIEGFVAVDPAGKVVSALTCYKCGTYRAPESLREESDWAQEELAEPNVRDDRAIDNLAYGSLALDGRPVYVSYAICTDPEYRGLGLAGRLTAYVRDLVTGGLETENDEQQDNSNLAGISIVSPAEESLEDFYSDLGYEPHFFASHGVALTGMEAGDEELMALAFDDDVDVTIWGDPDYNDMDQMAGELDDGEFGDDEPSFLPEIKLTPVSAAMYNKYREAFLAETPHIALSDKMMDFVKSESANGEGLYVVNGGDAICVVQGELPMPGEAEPQGEHAIMLAELLVNPVLADISYEIDLEIASMIADHFGLERMPYRTPGYGRCQSMLAAGTPTAQEEPDTLAEYTAEGPAYFGFPID